MVVWMIILVMIVSIMENSDLKISFKLLLENYRYYFLVSVFVLVFINCEKVLWIVNCLFEERLM